MTSNERVNLIIEYEMGQLSEEKAIELFQDLIDTGMAWTLQGHYGRTAATLIENGICHKAGQDESKNT